MTVNSFASVSLDPALVLWSIQRNSECFSDFEKVSAFSINVLTQDQRDISAAYARKGDHHLRAGHYCFGQTGVPVILGAVVSLECTVWARYDGGDHLILVGEVREMEFNNSLKDALVFYRGQYGVVR